MSNELPTKDDNSPQDGPAPTAPREGRLQRVVVWILLIGLIGTIVYEGTSRFWYHKSLAALLDGQRAAEASSTRLSAAQAAELIAGWPMTSQKESSGERETEYRWPSLLWDLRIQVRSNLTTGIVAKVTVGTGLAPKFDPSDLPFPQQPAQQGIFGIAAGGAPALALAQRGPGFLQNSTEQGRLIREIVRQALLIAARDELGLPTRDTVLGEVLPDDKTPVIPRLSTFITIDDKRNVLVNVEREHQGGTWSHLAAHQFQLPAGPVIDTLATQGEVLSIGEFAGTLKQAGLSGAGNKYVPEGKVADQIVTDLGKFELLAQFAAVRALHAEIRKSGESPERLAALARGYAQLGALSQFLWSPASKGYAARGLLYAERLKRKTAGSPLSLWTRAYVRGLTGLHKTALDDLAAAGAADGRAAVPDWVPAMRAYCQGDSTKLSQLSEQQEGAALPQFLMLLTFGQSQIQTQRLKVAVEMLKRQPDCELAFDIAVDQAALGIEREMTDQAAARFSATLRDFLKSRDGIPQDVRKLAAKPAGDLKADVETQMQMVLALRSAGGVGRDPGEPSLGALATLIRETSFVNACRLLYLERYSMRLDPSKTITAVRPLFIGHRYELSINVFAPLSQKAGYFSTTILTDDITPESWAARQIELADRPLLDASYFGMKEPPVTESEKANFDQRNNRGDGILLHRDKTFNDLVRALKFHATETALRKVAAELREVSPGSALGVAAVIEHDWENAQESISEWDTKFSHDAVVQRALAGKYSQFKRFDEAVRCRKRQIALFPEQTAMRALAELYKDHDDEQLWIETLQNSLKVPSYGLEHARTHADLAWYHMRRKDWDAARPHADAAAQSHARWGLICGAELYQRIGDWQRADQLRRAAAERYPDLGSDLDWYFWCRSTGHGDLAAARPLAQSWLARFKNTAKADELEIVGLVYIMEGQLAEALPPLTKLAAIDHTTENTYVRRNPSPCLHLALVADELGQTELRNEQFVETRTRGSQFHDYLHELVIAFQNCLATGSNHLDLSVIDWAIRDRARPGSATDEFYYVGKFLALHGREEEAREYLQRAATSSESGRASSRLAAHALLKAGHTPGERRNSEFDDATTKRLTALWRANRQRNEGDLEKALEGYADLIASDPDFADVWCSRAWAHRDREEFGPAIADLNRALELLPGCARLLEIRGQTLEYHGKYALAVKDYEQAIAIDSSRVLAHYYLALLRAACPKAEFRDASDARKHAQIIQSAPDLDRDLKLAALAAAHAEAGEFDEAIQLQTEAVKLAGNRQYFLEQRLKLYKNNQPYHRQPGWWRF